MTGVQTCALPIFLSDHVLHENDTFCRIGGEEFMLLMVDTCDSQTQQRADSIRRCIEEAQIPHSESSTSDYLTASVGFASLSASLDCLDFDLLYDMADKALYQAKDRGRNRVVSAFENSQIEATFY